MGDGPGETVKKRPAVDEIGGGERGLDWATISFAHMQTHSLQHLPLPVFLVLERSLMQNALAAISPERG